MSRVFHLFREVSVIEIRELLRASFAAKALRKVAAQSRVYRKTSRDYVNAALSAALSAIVVRAVHPRARPAFFPPCHPLRLKPPRLVRLVLEPSLSDLLVVAIPDRFKSVTFSPSSSCSSLTLLCTLTSSSSPTTFPPRSIDFPSPTRVSLLVPIYFSLIVLSITLTPPRLVLHSLSSPPCILLTFSCLSHSLPLIAIFSSAILFPFFLLLFNSSSLITLNLLSPSLFLNPQFTLLSF